jgi:transposase InsO family protein
MALTGPCQARAADITCIRTGEGFLYPSPLTDLFELPKGAFLVRRSDRSCQYCYRRYVEKLKDHGLPASMTGELHCYENAHAERLNGILKQEYSPGWSFMNKEQTLVAFGEAVSLYNTRWPRLSLNYETPETMHRRVA